MSAALRLEEGGGKSANGWLHARLNSPTGLARGESSGRLSPKSTASEVATKASAKRNTLGCPRESPLPGTGGLLEQLLDFIQNHLEQDLNVTQIAKAGGVSERTIHALFQRELGVSPIQYLRHQRLLIANRVFQDVRNRAVSVKEVALTLGFRDLGRFSQYYRSVFAELPSSTLLRSLKLKSESQSAATGSGRNY